MLFTEKMPFLWHGWRHQGESQCPGLNECSLAFPERLLVNPKSDGNVAALSLWVLPVLSVTAIWVIIVSFSFKMNKPALMDYFSIQTKHFTVCTQCCLYNLELSLLLLLNLQLLELLCGLLQQMGGRSHEYNLLGYDTGLCLEQKYSGKA